MAIKVDQDVFDRILELKSRYNLTNEVIATRLGISSRTVRVYLRAARLNLKPYQKPDVPSEDH